MEEFSVDLYGELISRLADVNEAQQAVNEFNKDACGGSWCGEPWGYEELTKAKEKFKVVLDACIDDRIKKILSSCERPKK